MRQAELAGRIYEVDQASRNNLLLTNLNALIAQWELSNRNSYVELDNLMTIKAFIHELC